MILSIFYICFLCKWLYKNFIYYGKYWKHGKKEGWEWEIMRFVWWFMEFKRWRIFLLLCIWRQFDYRFSEALFICLIKLVMQIEKNVDLKLYNMFFVGSNAHSILIKFWTTFQILHHYFVIPSHKWFHFFFSNYEWIRFLLVFSNI